MENFCIIGLGGRRVYVEWIIWLWRKVFLIIDKILILNNLLKYKFMFFVDGVLLWLILLLLNYMIFCDNIVVW